MINVMKFTLTAMIAAAKQNQLVLLQMAVCGIRRMNHVMMALQTVYRNVTELMIKTRVKIWMVSAHG